MKRILICAVIGMASMSMMAESYIYLSKNNVNLREAPSTTAGVADKGKEGTVFVVEEEQSGWYKGKNAQYGDTPVWISSTVAKKYEAENQKPAWNIVGMPEAVIPYANVVSTAKDETRNEWKFYTTNISLWNEEKPGTDFEATYTYTWASTSGSARQREIKYKGKGYAYYLELTEQSVDDGENYTKLETPIYIYPSLGGESGIYINGDFFADDVFDEDEW